MDEETGEETIYLWIVLTDCPTRSSWILGPGVYEMENSSRDPEMDNGSASEGMMTSAKRSGEKLMLSLELVREVLYVTEGP